MKTEKTRKRTTTAQKRRAVEKFYRESRAGEKTKTQILQGLAAEYHVESTRTIERWLNERPDILAKEFQHLIEQMGTLSDYARDLKGSLLSRELQSMREQGVKYLLWYTVDGRSYVDSSDFHHDRTGG